MVLGHTRMVEIGNMEPSLKKHVGLSLQSVN